MHAHVEHFAVRAQASVPFDEADFSRFLHYSGQRFGDDAARPRRTLAAVVQARRLVVLAVRRGISK